jgi:hypothetical protein
MLACTSCPFRCPTSQPVPVPTALANAAPADASTLPPPTIFPTCPLAGAATEGMGKAGGGPDALSDLAVLLYYRLPRV